MSKDLNVERELNNFFINDKVKEGETAFEFDHNVIIDLRDKDVLQIKARRSPCFVFNPYNF